MARTRNRCNGSGYESVALIPLRYREERLGLIQLNDHRPGMFSPRNMALYERLAGYLAVAIVRFQAEEEIRRLNQTLEQKVIKRTAQLEALNKELEGFSYSVSHDLQAPLRHMTGFVNLLHNQYRDKLDEKGLHYLQVLSDSAQKMAKMINCLLAYTRLGRVALRRVPVEMDKVLQEALQLVEPDLENRKVEWSIQSLPKVYGDPVLLRTALVNLIHNAVKFTRCQPRPSIEIGILPNREGEDIFCVSDNGAGFDMAYSHKLFGIFQRLHGQEEFEGTGLGLANTQRIIARHGGRVWAEGMVGEGATFYFSLPRGKTVMEKKPMALNDESVTG
jgi:light-regulated signal transduction histidine kinase (bacteriophytochrome)